MNELNSLHENNDAESKEHNGLKFKLKFIYTLFIKYL